MLSQKDDIHSVCLKFTDLKLTTEDKGRLDNLDSWVTEQSKKGVVTQEYIQQVFDKIAGEKKKQQEERKE